MDNNNKSKLFVQEIPRKYSDKIIFLTNQINIEKRKSDKLNFISSINKSRNIQSNKLNKIPYNIRSSYQEKSLIPNLTFGTIENSINNDNKDNKDKNIEASVKKDKNYYLNLLNDIYLNDSHYSNKNTVKNINNNSINNSNNNNSINNNSINSKNINKKKEMSNFDINKKFMKRKTCNLSKGRGSRDSLRKSHKSSKQSIFNINNDNKQKSKKLSINSSKDNGENKSNKKLSNFSKEMISSKQEPKILSEKAISTFKNPENSMKVKMNKIYKRFKSSQNIHIINEERNDETLKEENNENNETMQKEIKSIKMNISNKENNIRNSKRSRNIISENENGNLVRCSTKNISNKNFPSDKSIKIKNPKKMYKTFCLCCLIKNDDSFSDND